MNTKIAVISGLAFCLTTALAADDQPALQDQRDKVSYGIGMNIGNTLKMQGADVDVNLIARGIKDQMAGGETLLTAQEAQEALRAWQMEMRNKHMQKQKVEGEENKKKGEAFLAENAKKEGVKTLPSGLQYQVLASGTGPTPKSNDVVRAHYRGTLIDGTEFDSSYTRGQPFVTAANRVIRGWTEALTHMKVGDKWKLFIPPDLAYGEHGMPPKIGPSQVLIFELELLGIEQPKASPAPSGAPAK